MKRIPIGSRPTSRDELGGWYASILEEQARSGESVKEFAARAGISAWSLYQWRRRLSRGVSGRDQQPARLVEVALVQKERSQAGRLRVRLRCGHRVDVPAGFDDAELRRLIGVLESC
jgi:transposase-like protein